MTRFSRPVSSSSTAGEADDAADGVGFAGDVVAFDGDGPTVERQQSAEDADGGGFAGAVGAEEREHGAPLDAQVDALKHGGFAVRFGEAGSLDSVSVFSHQAF
jgi:hypothetical protein